MRKGVPGSGNSSDQRIDSTHCQLLKGTNGLHEGSETEKRVSDLHGGVLALVVNRRSTDCVIQRELDVGGIVPGYQLAQSDASVLYTSLYEDQKPFDGAKCRCFESVVHNWLY